MQSKTKTRFNIGGGTSASMIPHTQRDGSPSLGMTKSFQIIFWENIKCLDDDWWIYLKYIADLPLQCERNIMVDGNMKRMPVVAYIFRIFCSI